MKFKASLDTLAIIITLATVILFFILGYFSVRALAHSHGDLTTLLVHGGILLLLTATLAGCYLYAPQSYVIDKEHLVIIRPAGNIKINLADILSVTPIPDNPWIGAIRTFGVGGLFGYYGKFYASSYGSMTYYATKLKGKILIQTRKNKKIILTPDDPGMTELLKQKSALQ